MADRRALLEDVLTQRAMSVAALPADDHEPGAYSPLWPFAIASAATKAATTRDPEHKRDQIVLLGGHVLAWLEAIDDELEHVPRDPPKPAE